MNTTGNVYATDSGHNRVLKLPAGSNTAVKLPFTGLENSLGVAVDISGDVYVADSDSDHVLVLRASRCGRTRIDHLRTQLRRQFSAPVTHCALYLTGAEGPQEPQAFD
ncbi:hypothetical protein [Antrihabitans stalactiti]|uniref:NHL repeat-containing protein n=1 Tax=Antrihabitans stalactiti TaxID=2584121 RepID=A0A848KL82_9NOCA|nr:hypothetical protein [Antrihabitans stalactiti]NMN98648.1 hypothetical protein [Antrihabitans stalactiti]